MTDQIDIARVTGKLAELDKQVSVQEERMNTRHAETESAMDRLRADLAQRDVDSVKRDKQQLLAILGIVALATTILGLMIAITAS